MPSRDVAVIRALPALKLLLMAEQAGLAPQMLANLDLSVEETTDPFTDQPLKVKLTNKGWFAYFAGSNEIDDGEKSASDEDSEFAVK